MSIICPTLVPKPYRGKVSVFWLVDQEGACLGRDYYDATPECRKALLAQAMQLAIKGKVGLVPENGHPLHGDFKGLHVLKPGDHRFMYFRRGDRCYITNGAPKRSKKRQEPDYRVALGLMNDFDEHQLGSLTH